MHLIGEKESVGDLSAFCKAKLFVQQEIRLKLDLAREFAFFPIPTFVSGNLRESTSMLPPDRVVLDSPQTCAAAKNFSSLLKVFGVGTRSAPLPLLTSNHLLQVISSDLVVVT